MSGFWEIGVFSRKQLRIQSHFFGLPLYSATLNQHGIHMVIELSGVQLNNLVCNNPCDFKIE